VPYQMFRGSDERFFVVAVGSQALWKKFAELLGMAETLGRDVRFSTNALRIENRGALIPILQNAFDLQTAASWVESLRRAEIPAAPINTVPEAVGDPQTLARGLIVQLEHPALGAVRSIANPIKFSNTPVSYRLPPPLLGEHTNEILQSLAEPR